MELTPDERFAQLLIHIRHEIRDIDNDTVWESVEPKWWLRMMEINRLAGKALRRQSATVDKLNAIKDGE